MFETVLQIIVHGKCFHEKFLAQTRYSQWKSWANTQPQFRHWDPRALKKLADNINNAVFVYENLELIVSNLTDPRIKGMWKKNERMIIVFLFFCFFGRYRFMTSERNHFLSQETSFPDSGSFGTFLQHKNFLFIFETQKFKNLTSDCRIVSQPHKHENLNISYF